MRPLQPQPDLDPALDEMLRAMRRFNEAAAGACLRQLSDREQGGHWLPSALDQHVKMAAAGMRRLAIMLLNCGPGAQLSPPAVQHLVRGDSSSQCWADLSRSLNILQQGFRHLLSAAALDLEGTPYANGLLARELQQTVMVVDSLCVLVELSNSIIDGRSNVKMLGDCKEVST